MDAFFAQVQEGFEKLGRDISVAVDKLGSDYNRANGALKRAETARKTGIVTERNARLSAFPEYVCELGEAAKVVDVSENAIASLPRALAGLTRVHRLCASHNALVALPQGLCPGWVSLKVLRLERNKLASLPPDLGELARLEELWLSDNQIESLPSSVAKLKRLRTVRLARNRLRFDDDDDADDDDEEKKKKRSLRFLGACADARELVLDGNPGIARVPASFGALAKLETLSLDDTRVATVPAAVFEGCVSLKRLSLKKTRIARDENAAAKLRAVAGFDAFDARRARSRDKQIACDVLGSGMDDVLGTNETKR